MRQWLIVLTVCGLPAAASALSVDRYPFVQDGPVITGVTPHDAWIAWYTAHHQGTGAACSLDALTGSPNTDVPTLTLGDGTAFTDATCSRYHKVHLTELLPSTAYTFTLDKPWDAQGGATPSGSFTTAPDGTAETFKFVVYGDNRDNQTSPKTQSAHQAVVDAIVANEPDAAFLLQTGDLALNLLVISGDDNGYTEFFQVERKLLASKPIFAVLGNHETIDTTFYDAMFDAPRFNGAANPYFYAMDWGQVHIALGDSFEGSLKYGIYGDRQPLITATQQMWLDADLKAARAANALTFVAYHQGPFSHSSDAAAHGGSKDFQTNALPLMLQYGALAAFAGHDHYYQHNHEGVPGGACVDTFVIGGGGAPMYAPDPAGGPILASQKVSSYAVVSVQGQSATIDVKDTSGNVIDSYTLAAPDTAAKAAMDGTCAPATAHDGGTGGCSASTDCPSGDVCTGGTCVTACACNNDLDCPSGDVCNACACVPAPTDGGTGSTGTTGSTGSTGASDAGTGGTTGTTGATRPIAINGGCHCGSGGAVPFAEVALLVAAWTALRRRRA